MGDAGLPMFASFSAGSASAAVAGSGHLASLAPDLVTQLSETSKQLSMQMELNSDLLAQLQRLEEEQLAAQRGIVEKQAALRQALAVADAARSEVTDTKRKLAIAQVRVGGAVRLSTCMRTVCGGGGGGGGSFCNCDATVPARRRCPASSVRR